MCIRDSTNCDRKVGHGGQDRMLQEIQRQFRNVSHGIVMNFLAQCEHYEKKRYNKRKGLIVKPILSSHMNYSRRQVDLTDMQSSPDNDYKFICVYQDRFKSIIIQIAIILMIIVFIF